MGFDPYNCSLKIQESIGTPTPKMGAHLGMCHKVKVRVATNVHKKNKSARNGYKSVWESAYSSG
jgi:hypothetical protein